MYSNVWLSNCVKDVDSVYQRQAILSLQEIIYGYKFTHKGSICPEYAISNNLNICIVMSGSFCKIDLSRCFLRKSFVRRSNILSHLEAYLRLIFGG